MPGGRTPSTSRQAEIKGLWNQPRLIGRWFLSQRAARALRNQKAIDAIPAITGNRSEIAMFINHQIRFESPDPWISDKKSILLYENSVCFSATTFCWSPFWRWSTGHVRLSYRLAMTVWEWLWIVDEPNGSASFVAVPSFFPSRVWWVFPKSKQFQRSKTGWAENWLLLLSQLEELPLFSCIGEPPGILHENY